MRGENVSTFSLMLNTAVAVGSDVLCVLARIHGQCEIHGYVLGPHREWLAGLVEEGLRVGVMRPNEGWSALVEYLRRSDTEPVVLSYSVTDDFPNPHTAKRGGWTLPEGGSEGDVLYEAWRQLSPQERWDYSFKGLEPALRIGPDTIRVGFDGGASALTLLAEAAGH